MRQCNSSGRAKSYYTTADYYTEGQELVGLWRGKGAERLGLFGTIAREDWDALCDNIRPDSGEPLTPRRKSERRVGYDISFNCPKSVSLLYGLTRDERLVTAFQESVEETMREMEEEAKARVRKDGANEDRVTGNLVWGEFTHLTSRPEEGTPDPHLHAHCFAFNATFDPHPHENRWKAAQFGDLKRDAPYFEAVFHSKLARKVEELGLETVRTPERWNIVGIDPRTLKEFSRRTTRIERIAREKGITDPEKKGALGAKTRTAKAKELGMSELRELWRSRLSDSEAGDLDALARKLGGSATPEDVREAKAAVQRAMEHIFARASVVPERVLLAEALKQGYGKASRSTIENLMAREQLINAYRDGQKLVTTREVLAEETKMLAIAREGRGECRPINPGRMVFHRDWLNADQKAAVRHVLSSRDRVMVIRGVAGAGKTSALQEVREGLEESGVPVHAFAQSSGASRGVLREEGFTDAETLASLLDNPRRQAEMKNALILVDEAGQVGTESMRTLLEIAKREDARVLLVGDIRQHGPVERGAALRLLETEAGLLPAEIKEIQRQKEKYKAAVKDLSEGKIKEGFARLDQLGWVREVADDDRNRALASAYLEAVREGKSALVVSPTHAEGGAITQAIRGQLKEAKLIDGDEREFAQLAPKSLTLGQQRDPTSYEPGDVIVFHQNAKGYQRGQRLAVEEAPIPFDQAERFTVYRRGMLGLAVGDRIRITKNGNALDGFRLNNGDLFAVKGFTDGDDLRVTSIKEKKTQAEHVISKDYGHLAHGLVVTSYASQGKTVDRVFIGQSSRSFRASSKEQFYVSASRGREQALVFTDDKEELLDAVKRSDERLSATELVQGLDLIRKHVARERVRADAIEVAVGAGIDARASEHGHERGREHGGELTRDRMPSLSPFMHRHEGREVALER